MNQTQSFLELPFIFDIEKLKDDLNCVNREEWVNEKYLLVLKELSIVCYKHKMTINNDFIRIISV